MLAPKYVIKKEIKYAFKYYGHDSQVMKTIDIKKESKKLKRKEVNFLTPEEIPLFLALVSPRFYTFFTTAIYTGMTMGELKALHWEDIDWNNNSIHVKIRNVFRRHNKTKKYLLRKVSVSHVLLKELDRYRKTTMSDYGLVFPENRANDKKIYKKELEAALKRTGLRQIRFSDLRHTYVALMISQGKNINYIQHQLGHDSILTTLNTYSCLLHDSQKTKIRVG